MSPAVHVSPVQIVVQDQRVKLVPRKVAEAVLQFLKGFLLRDRVFPGQLAQDLLFQLKALHQRFRQQTAGNAPVDQPERQVKISQFPRVQDILRQRYAQVFQIRIGIQKTTPSQFSSMIAQRPRKCNGYRAAVCRDTERA